MRLKIVLICIGIIFLLFFTTATFTREKIYPPWLENAHEGSTMITIYNWGETIYNSYNFDNAGPDSWRNIEVTINGVLVSGDFLLEATSKGKKLTATQSDVDMHKGDMIKIRLSTPLKRGDEIRMTFRPTGQIIILQIVV